MRVLLLALSLMLLVPGAKAESALKMAADCQSLKFANMLDGDIVSVPATFEAGYCWGAFLSIQRSTRLIEPSALYPLLTVCAPPESTLMQFVQIFIRYVDEHPELAHKHYLEIALDALRAAFPCN